MINIFDFSRLFKAADQYLHDREAIDAALIFKTESELDQSLYWLIGNSYIRFVYSTVYYVILFVFVCT